MVNVSGKVQTKDITIDGVKKIQSQGKWIVLKSDELNEVNSFAQPKAVSPAEQTIAVKNKKINISVAPYSFNIIRVKMQ
jgi:alpha-L-arabinofuranosidase